MDGVLALARFGLMADLALLMGLPLFWWAMSVAGQRALLVALALMGMALSALWLLASAASMTGTPLLPPDWATAEILLTMTPIGPVLVVRGVALLTALALAVAGRNHWVLIPAAIAVATIAWTGHAGATEAVAGSVHRVADVAHIWAACGWIGALAALLHAVTMHRPHIDRVAVMLAKFSLLGTVFVATLVVTGVVNSLMIVGVTDLPALVGSRYGWLLGAKLALFGAMLGLAALNRWRLTPALERGADGAVRALRLSLAVETGAAIGILALVAWLGTLDPLA
jgi:putative copper resistance protein D